MDRLGPAHHPKALVPAVLTRSRAVMWVALLLLCAAYLQGGLNKLTDFDAAVAEMRHFDLSPAAPLALAVILVELGGSALILSGFYRWLGALVLAGFTLFATFVANRFWEVPQPERFMVENTFFEHLGLVGGFVLVAWHDLRERLSGDGGTDGGA
jgi:uncharacterized membrane protein YphA (DoxX/SURF4 family)